MLGRLRAAVEYQRSIGTTHTLALIASRVAGRETFSVPLPGDPRTVQLRFRATDYEVYEKVIVQGEYRLTPATRPAVILDAGAYIGLSAVDFALRFPGALVLAVEPERSNFELLERNTAHFPNVKPIRAALWSEDTVVEIADPGSGKWGFQVAPRTHGPPVPAVTVGTLMKQHGISSIDVLKVDIEGAEREVFETSAPWIGRVETVVAELHDRFKPGAARAFCRATDGFEWEWARGENRYVSRLPPPDGIDGAQVRGRTPPS